MDLSKLGITPGPWEVDFDEVDDIYSDNVHIATVKNRKNTYVIKSSKEMLEALIDNQIQIERDSPEMDFIIQFDVKRVIEKATGLSWEQVKKKLDLE